MNDHNSVSIKQTTAKPERYFIKRISNNNNDEGIKNATTTDYYYVNYDYPSIVKSNVVIFTVLHLIFAHGFYLTTVTISWPLWIFIYLWALLGGLGITAGAHRLWCHRAYKATYGLRFFLMLCNCIAGQNDLIEWCRDHRLHHKHSETDADPHNSNRGWFFAHIGWLMQKKHPKVLEYGKKIDLTDLYSDPVLVFQRRYYWPLALNMGLFIPMAACVFMNESLMNALSIAIWRYICALHCTWFVNSAAHIWGSQDYDKNISSRESVLVSVGAIGEGFHNYHHTFPYDYSASEHGGYFNFTTMFIDTMSYFGLAYDLKSVDKRIVDSRRLRTGEVKKQSYSIFKHLCKIVKFHLASTVVT